MLDKATLAKRLQSRVDTILVALIIRFLPGGLKPNHLTFLRLVLVVPLVMLLAFGFFWESLALFLFLSLLDLVDGAMARTRDERSDLGKLLDPIADKVLVGTTLLVIGPSRIGWAIIIAVLSIEVIIIIGGLVAKLMGSKTEANIYGKLKMTLQVLGIVLLIVGMSPHMEWLFEASLFVFYLALILAVLSVAASKSYFRHVGRPLALFRKRAS
ncbi:MAG: CDP-alcohol phosphatidyltransferase family protein [Dehalococcoidia bacterium]|nr:CDP-alcohol phosphatidyltransferase family protein [Dehalococcoidia bacterium]